MIKEVLTARGRLQAMDRGVEPLLHERAIEMQLHVSRPLELLENHLVHLAAGIDERGSENRQAAALFAVARRAKKFLWLEQRFGLNTARHGPAFAGLERIVTARQPRDTVE